MGSRPLTDTLPVFEPGFQALMQRLGFCTFDEFCKDPQKWMNRDDELLAAADRGSQTELRDKVRKHHYHFDHYQTTIPEKMEEILANEGFENTNQLDMTVKLEKVSGGKVDCHVYFRRKPSPILLGGQG